MEKHNLEIRESKGKDGQVYKNINLMTRIDKNSGVVVNGIPVGKYIDVMKKFSEGLQGVSGNGWSLYNIRVEYEGNEVTLSLMDNTREDSDYKKWQNTGGVDDTIRITVGKREYEYKGAKKTQLTLAFTKV